MKKCSWYIAIALVLMAVNTAFGADLRLIDASKKSDVKTVRLLIAQHVDINASEPDGSTALYWAAQRANADIVDVLLAAGANPKIANRYKVTPLSLASMNGDAAII